MKKINLLHIITGLGVGGAERVVLDLVKNSNQEKFNVSVVSLSKRNEMLKRFIGINIDVKTLNGSKNINDLVKMVAAVNRHIKSHRIQIIHAHMTHSLILSVLIKLMNPAVKLVFTSHNISFGSVYKNIIIYFLKVFRSKDILFSTEQESRIYKKNFEIIPNGVHVNSYKASEVKYEKFTFISVGRLEKQKNQLNLIDSAIYLKNKGCEFQILIAGDGYLRKSIEKLIADNQLQDYVILLGLRSDIPTLLSKSHIFVMPSLWEGLPIVLLEAAASSLPIISTPVGTIPSLIDENAGYLSSIDAFPKAMLGVISNYGEAQKKSHILHRKVVDNYSIENITRKHESLYTSLIYE